MTTGKEIVGGFFGAFGEGKVAEAMALLAADVRWTYHAPEGVIPWAGTYTGPEGVGQFFSIFGEAAEPIEMSPTGMWEQDGIVFVEGIERSRVKATGKEYAVGWVHKIVTADGKIASLDEFIDSAAVAAAFA